MNSVEKKVEAQFIDYGCGFPIILRNVPMRKVEGKWIPNIDYNKYEKIVALMLCYKQSKLIGSELRFIRLYLGMNLKVFAKRFGIKHPTVIKWENHKDMHTNMSLGTEKDIRLCLISYLTGKRKISDLYDKLVDLPLSPTEPQENVEINLDLEKITM